MVKGTEWLIILVLIGLGIWAAVKFIPVTVVQPDRVAQPPVGVWCGDDALADLEVKYRNLQATGIADYQAVALNLIDDTGVVKATYTTPTDGTYATTANVLECGKEYKVGVVNSPVYSAKMSPYMTANGAKMQYYIEGSNSSEVQFLIYTLAYANETSPSGVWKQDVTSSTNNVLDSGGTLTMRFDIQTSSGSAVFGSDDYITETDTGVSGKAFVCADFNLAKYSKGDITISYPGIVRELATLPEFCSVNAYEKAWEIKSLAASDGTLSGTVTITASLGDPSDADNVKFIWLDNSYYIGTDGKLKVGTVDTAGVDTSETNRYFIINIT